MCWGMIGWGWKGLLYIWEAETKKEREEAVSQIASLNKLAKEKEDQLNMAWQNSAEWKEL